jgi:hypothetical protein
MSITITIPGVDRWDGAAIAASALASLVIVLLPVLEEAVPGLGVVLAVARLARVSVSVEKEPVR